MAGKKEVGAKGETVVSYKGFNNDLANIAHVRAPDWMEC